MSDEHHRPRCSFCGKSQEAVKKLVAGTSKLEDGTYVYICDECVSLCVEIIGDEPVNG